MSKKLKENIAFFLPSLDPGGAERNVVNIINNINRERYKITLVLGEKKGDFVGEIDKDVPIIGLGASNSFKLFLKILAYFAREKPDIFISSFSRINIICIVAANLFSGKNIKTIAIEHNLFSLLPLIAKTPDRRIFAHFFLPQIVRFVYPKASAIVCVSRGIAEDLIKVVGCREKIKVIHNPVTNNNIKKLAEENISGQGLLDIKAPLIIAVGRLVKCKDYPCLFRALNLVLKKQPAHLIILGSGPEEHNLKKMVDEFSLSSHVTFLGFQKNPYKYMKRASVFVLSSLAEGFGNVIVEAMALGCPVVSTDCPTGPSEIIENMKNGILVAVGDEKSLAFAILSILNSPQLAEKFSVSGMARAEYFSVEKSVSEYEKLFEDLINSPSK